MTFSTIVAASAFLSFAAAAPVQNRIFPRSLETRQAPNCNIGTQVDNPNAYDSSCWDTLGIMQYLTNWKATTPTCTDAENSAGQTLSCCGASEPWSTCFLRLATTQLNAYDCTQLTPTGNGPSCSLEANGGRAFALQGLDPTIASQVNYVALNIITINNFFATYYTGQSLPTCLTKHSSIDHEPSSPKCGTERRENLGFLALKHCFEWGGSDESTSEFTERDGGIDPRSVIPSGTYLSRSYCHFPSC